MDIDIFKWVMGSIAGALLLIFFFAFSFGHVKLSSSVQDRSLLERIAHEFEAFGVSEAASKVMKLPSKVTFSCGKYGSAVRIGAYERELGVVVFASDSQFDTFRLWTREWDWPFFAGNFYYAWDGKPIVVAYDESSRSFVDSLDVPEWLAIEKVAVRTLAQPEPGKRYAFFSQVPSSFHQESVEIEDDGTVVVWNQGTMEKHFWLGKEMLFGLLIGGGKEYGCLQERAVEQLKRVAESYQDKARLMLRREQKIECQQILQGITHLAVGTEKDELQLFYQQWSDAEEGLIGEGCEKLS